MGRLVSAGRPARLAAAGLSTPADQLAVIRRRRHRWHTEVPNLSPKGGQRIMNWLTLHASSLGQVLSPLTASPCRQLVVGHPALARASIAGELSKVVHALRISVELEVSHGLNRAPVPTHQTELDTDLHAIAIWIKIRGAKSIQTTRAHRREAERLLLWAMVQKLRPLSSLTKLDCTGYIAGFLRDAHPADRWVGRGRVARFVPTWRPFAGQLDQRSRERARKILRSVQLDEKQYLVGNSFDGLATFDGIDEIDAIGRTLTYTQWKYVPQTTRRVTDTPEEQHDHFTLRFAYARGQRRAELDGATSGDLARTALDGVLVDEWDLKVRGLWRHNRRVNMPVRLMEKWERALQYVMSRPC